MAENRSQNSDFSRSFNEAKKNAAGVVNEATESAQDLYDHARRSASDLADATTDAAVRTAGSFEQALRNTIENQPYMAVAIALGLGWLFGRTHRPL